MTLHGQGKQLDSHIAGNFRGGTKFCYFYGWQSSHKKFHLRKLMIADMGMHTSPWWAWLVQTTMAWQYLYCYCRPADAVLNPNILTEISWSLSLKEARFIPLWEEGTISLVWMKIKQLCDVTLARTPRKFTRLKVFHVMMFYVTSVDRPYSKVYPRGQVYQEVRIQSTLRHNMHKAYTMAFNTACKTSYMYTINTVIYSSSHQCAANIDQYVDNRPLKVVRVKHTWI